MSLNEAVEAHQALTALEAKADKAREARNAAVIAAHENGETAYRIAKALDLAESTIGRIIKAGGNK